jgi:metal-sulfur cluster biosynthetic enzyme
MISLATVPASGRDVFAGDGPKRSGDEQRYRNMGQDPLIDLPSGTDKAAILDRLARVMDLELDESILSLGFVRSISLRDFHATVTLQLPTSWCALNFTFIMAEDVRSALLAVDGIRRVTVLVGDHASADEIEGAVNSGTPFASAFRGEAGQGIAALRALFLRKGFLMRQEVVLRALRAAGLAAAAIEALNVGDDLEQFGLTEAAQRYLERLVELGLDGSSDAPLIVDPDGAALTAARLDAWYQHIRTIRVTQEANGSFCRAVLATRQKAPAGSSLKQKLGREYVPP